MKRGERARREAPPAAEMNPAQKMGKRLREARLRLSMTQSEVAGDQFSVSYISAVERGQIRPSLGALEQLSDRLDVPLTDLVSDERLTEIPSSGGREALIERRQEEAESRLRLAQAQLHQGKRAEALETLRNINVAHLASHNALERSRLLAAGYIGLDRLEEARKEALDGIAMAERAGDEEMRARLRNQLGAAYLAGRKTQLALEQFHQAYESVQHAVAPDPLFRLDVLHNLGVAHWMLSENTEAATYLREAVDLTEQLANPERLGDACWALSASYAGQGDARRAKLYAQRALASYEQAETHSLTARAYTRLGRVTAQANKFEEALSLLNQAQTMTEREQDAHGQSEVQRSLAAVFVSQKRPADAKAAANAALALAQSANDDVLIAEAQLALAQVLDAQNQPKDAEANFEQAIALLEKSGARQHLSDAYAAFSSFLDARGQSKRALEVLRQAWNIREGANA